MSLVHVGAERRGPEPKVPGVPGVPAPEWGFSESGVSQDPKEPITAQAVWTG
jgi:hypothetical protein